MQAILKPHHLHIVFDRREAGNAFDLEAAQHLTAIRHQHRGWKGPVVVSSTNPRFFCSGGNLTSYKRLPNKAAGLKINRAIARELEQFSRWKVPKLAVVEGDALGGGLEWLSMFDFRWCAPHVLFAFWQRRVGLSPGWGGGAKWTTTMSESDVRGLLLEARPLSSSEALRLGIVDRVVGSWTMWNEVETWSRRLHDLPAPEVVNWTTGNESRLFSKLWMGRDHSAALSRWKK